MPRPKGSINKRARHDAGGKRQGAGRPRLQRDAPAVQLLRQPTMHAFRVPTNNSRFSSASADDGAANDDDVTSDDEDNANDDDAIDDDDATSDCERQAC